MDSDQWLKQATRYREDLTVETIPFWLKHSMDMEFGGYLSCLDRDGSLLDDDKSGWVQGRFAWLLARLSTEAPDHPEYLEAARHGIQFIKRCGYTPDRRMWFQMDRSGVGLRKRRYAYTEFFACMAFAEWYRASGDERAIPEAERLFKLACEDMRGGRGPSKMEPVRAVKSLGVPMITLGVAHVLEDCGLGEISGGEREEAVADLRVAYSHSETGALLETVGIDVSLSGHMDGRIVNPGHSIEASWFLMEEHRRRGDEGVLMDALRILEGAWSLGWDEEHGGLFSLVDVSKAPVQETWAELKYWWPHCEAILAFLHAALATGEQEHVARWRLVHDWAHGHFHDPENGEWYGYLRRDGSVLNPAKGNLWKGPFHVPRMQLMAANLCDELSAGAER